MEKPVPVRRDKGEKKSFHLGHSTLIKSLKMTVSINGQEEQLSYYVRYAAIMRSIKSGKTLYQVGCSRGRHSTLMNSLRPFLSNRWIQKNDGTLVT